MNMVKELYRLIEGVVLYTLYHASGKAKRKPTRLTVVCNQKTNKLETTGHGTRIDKLIAIYSYINKFDSPDRTIGYKVALSDCRILTPCSRLSETVNYLFIIVDLVSNLRFSNEFVIDVYIASKIRTGGYKNKTIHEFMENGEIQYTNQFNSVLELILQILHGMKNRNNNELENNFEDLLTFFETIVDHIITSPKAEIHV